MLGILYWKTWSLFCTNNQKKKIPQKHPLLFSWRVEYEAVRSRIVTAILL